MRPERHVLSGRQSDDPDFQAGLAAGLAALGHHGRIGDLRDRGPVLAKSFLNSGFTVALCCLWPTVINTSVGVASIDRDLINVGRVIKLPRLTNIAKIVLPSALPMVFTGLRLSLATGWMVLIAAEMLSQN